MSTEPQPDPRPKCTSRMCEQMGCNCFDEPDAPPDPTPPQPEPQPSSIPLQLPEPQPQISTVTAPLVADSPASEGDVERGGGEPQQSAVEWVLANLVEVMDEGEFVFNALSDKDARELAERCDAAEAGYNTYGAKCKELQDQLAAAQARIAELEAAATPPV